MIAPAIKDILDEAKKIYIFAKEYKKKNKPSSETNVEDEELIKEIQSNHREFISVYAVVVKSIVYSDSKLSMINNALEKYIKHLKNHPWNSREEFIDRQADWYVHLERERNPRIGAKPLAEFRDKVRKQLHEEDKEFMKMATSTKDEVDAEREEILKDRRERIVAQIMKMKAETA